MSGNHQEQAAHEKAMRSRYFRRTEAGQAAAADHDAFKAAIVQSRPAIETFTGPALMLMFLALGTGCLRKRDVAEQRAANAYREGRR